MKLKQATKLAIIGVILDLVTRLIWILLQMNIVDYGYWTKSLNFVSFIGTALLLPFFVTLYKSQK